MTLNYNCIHNVSDEDCNKCLIHGILPACPERCNDYNKVVKVDDGGAWVGVLRHLMNIKGVVGK